METRNSPGPEPASGPERTGELGVTDEVAVPTSGVTVPALEVAAPVSGVSGQITHERTMEETARKQPQRAQDTLDPTVTGMIQQVTND